MKQLPLTHTMGVFGGTFDPIHYGHIKPLLEISAHLPFDSISLLPAHVPPHKTNTHTELKHRLSMLELVCQQYPLFHIDKRELRRKTPSFTVDTLEEIKREQPNTTICFFIGFDSLINLPSWHRWQALFSLCHLIVQERPNYHAKHLPSNMKEQISERQVHNLQQLSTTSAGSIYFSKHQHVDVSSTHIRAALTKNLSCDDLLPAPVLRYIKQHSLYSCNLHSIE